MSITHHLLAFLLRISCVQGRVRSERYSALVISPYTAPVYRFVETRADGRTAPILFHLGETRAPVAIMWHFVPSPTQRTCIDARCVSLRTRAHFARALLHTR